MEYKRKFREMDDATKQKISQSLRGKSKSFTHKENISNKLKAYWKNIPHRSKDNNTDNNTDYGTQEKN